ncbi:fluoride efflux transporter CrcB [Dichotomicrobium thermohalophilum]|nr:fluoride efflux transporter CrcB [Dichotomicrobium thermohalophilum]
MTLVFLAAAGGAIGAALRHLTNILCGQLFGSSFPWGTFAVNVIGSLAIGLVFAGLAVRWSAPLEARTFLVTGVLGGFTTFSAFSMDFAALVERKAYLSAAGYAGGTVALCFLAVFAGLAVGRAIFQ